jgi:hypothetical protein
LHGSVGCCWWRFGGGGFFARHLLVSLKWRSEVWYLLGGVVLGKCDRVGVKDRDQVIGDRGRDEPAEGLSELAVVSLVPAHRIGRRRRDELDIFQVAFAFAFAEEMGRH